MAMYVNSIALATPRRQSGSRETSQALAIIQTRDGGGSDGSDGGGGRWSDSGSQSLWGSLWG